MVYTCNLSTLETETEGLLREFQAIQGVRVIKQTNQIKRKPQKICCIILICKMKCYTIFRIFYYGHVNFTVVVKEFKENSEGVQYSIVEVPFLMLRNSKLGSCFVLSCFVIWSHVTQAFSERAM